MYKVREISRGGGGDGVETEACSLIGNSGRQATSENPTTTALTRAVCGTTVTQRYKIYDDMTVGLRPIAQWAAIQDTAACADAKRHSSQSDRCMLPTSGFAH